MALFKRKFISLILQGAKTHTRRTHKHGWKVGCTYKLKENYFDKGQGEILITRKFKQQLGEISQEDAVKEGFKNKEEFEKAWREINGTWIPEQIVTVYEFHKTEKQLEQNTTTEKVL